MAAQAAHLVDRALVTEHDVANKILDAMPRAARASPSSDESLVYEPAFA
jgi:hypothetical protein